MGNIPYGHQQSLSSWLQYTQALAARENAMSHTMLSAVGMHLGLTHLHVAQRSRKWPYHEQ